MVNVLFNGLPYIPAVSLFMDNNQRGWDVMRNKLINFLKRLFYTLLQIIGTVITYFLIMVVFLTVKQYKEKSTLRAAVYSILFY